MLLQRLQNNLRRPFIRANCRLSLATEKRAVPFVQLFFLAQTIAMHFTPENDRRFVRLFLCARFITTLRPEKVSEFTKHDIVFLWEDKILKLLVD